MIKIQHYILDIDKKLSGTLSKDELFLFDAFISHYEWIYQNLKVKSHLQIIQLRIKGIIVLLSRIFIVTPLIKFKNNVFPQVIFLPRSKTHFNIHLDILKKLPGSYFLFANYSPDLNDLSVIEYKVVSGKIPHFNKYALLCFKLILKSWGLPSYKISNTRKIAFCDLFLGAYLYGEKQLISNLILCNSLKKLTPKLIVVGNDFTLAGRCVVKYFKNSNIKTACVQHGTISDLQFRSIISDKYYLFGKNDFNLAIENGVSKEKLFIAGSAKVDDLKFNNAKKYAAKEKLHINLNDTLILILFSKVGHTVSESHHLELIDLIRNAAGLFPEFYFVFKLHSRDNIKYYHKVKGIRNILIYEDKENSGLGLNDWLSSSDIVVTGASTAALEAFLHKKPVITVDILKELPKYSFIKKGITFHVNNLSEFIGAVNSIITKDEKYISFLNKVESFLADEFANYATGSNSAEIIAGDILKDITIE